jgi:hypothetical protein
MFVNQVSKSIRVAKSSSASLSSSRSAINQFSACDRTASGNVSAILLELKIA